MGGDGHPALPTFSLIASCFLSLELCQGRCSSLENLLNYLVSAPEHLNEWGYFEQCYSLSLSSNLLEKWSYREREGETYRKGEGSSLCWFTP